MNADTRRLTTNHAWRRAICGCAAIVIAAAVSTVQVSQLAAQNPPNGPKARAPGNTPGNAPGNTPGKLAPPPAVPSPPKFPPRTPFTAADNAIAAIPGMPDVRFWADSENDFNKALPAQRGPWLILSTGGADGAFGAGLLNGLRAAGKRPDYAVVTGVSTGALMAPFIFAGARYDVALAAVYTQTSAADIFEVGGTGESFLDTWPLRDLITKQINAPLLADIAAAHQAGRRLFIVTTDLDSGRSVVWNMGAIAVHGGEAAIKLFRSVLLASGRIARVLGKVPPPLR